MTERVVPNVAEGSAAHLNGLRAPSGNVDEENGGSGSGNSEENDVGTDADRTFNEPQRSSISRQSRMAGIWGKSMKRLESFGADFGQKQSLFVDEYQDRCLARLLLENRSFGYPGTDGRLFSNYMAYLMNRHPLLSIFFCHPHHPFTKGERIVVLWCSIFWAFATNGAMEIYYPRDASGNGTLAYYGYITILALLIIPFEILIRVVIICPCCLQSELRATEKRHSDVKRAERNQLKKFGQGILLGLVLLSIVCFIVGMLAALGVHHSGLDGKRQAGDEAYRLDKASLLLLLVKVWQLGPVWILQWTPAFLVWYNRDKAAWFAAHPDPDQPDRLCCKPTAKCPVWDFEGLGSIRNGDLDGGGVGEGGGCCLRGGRWLCCGRWIRGCRWLCTILSTCFDWLEKVLCPESCHRCYPCGNTGPCAPIQRCTGWGCLRCGDDDGTGGGFDRAPRAAGLLQQQQQGGAADGIVAVAEIAPAMSGPSGPI